MDSLARLLNEFSNRKVCVIEPGGHLGGDDLIYLGGNKLFKKLGLNTQFISKWHQGTIHGNRRAIGRVINHLMKLYQMLRFDKPSPKDVIYLHGGGNINEIYLGKDLLRQILEVCPRTPLIVGPHTFYFNKTKFEKTFEGTKQQIFLFCRELFSYEYVRSLDLPSNVSIHHSKDTAFYLSPDDFNIDLREEKDWLCFRSDKERRDPKGLFKILDQTDKIILDVTAFKTFKGFIETVAKVRRVYSNRLHVCIISAIFGKEVYIYPNSYWKNLAVYEYSLNKNPKVRFIGERTRT